MALTTDGALLGGMQLHHPIHLGLTGLAMGRYGPDLLRDQVIQAMTKGFASASTANIGVFDMHASCSVLFVMVEAGPGTARLADPGGPVVDNCTAATGGFCCCFSKNQRQQCVVYSLPKHAMPCNRQVQIIKSRPCLISGLQAISAS